MLAADTKIKSLLMYRYKELPFNIFVVFTFIVLTCILLIISYQIIRKYPNKMKKVLFKIYHHGYKTSLILITCSSVIFTIVAYIIGFNTVNTYKLSPNFLIPNFARAIYGIILSGGFTALVIFCPAWIHYITKNMHKVSLQAEQKSRSRVNNVAKLVVTFAILLFIYVLIFLVDTKPFYMLNATVMQVIVSILLALALAASVLQYYTTIKNIKKLPLEITTVILSAFSYTMVIFIALFNIGGSVFTPNSGYNEYEYITTAEYGDCIILMKNGSEYVLEKFTYDEDSQAIIIYTNQYYVHNLSSAEIKRISYKKEVLLPNDSG